MTTTEEAMAALSKVSGMAQEKFHQLWQQVDMSNPEKAAPILRELWAAMILAYGDLGRPIAASHYMTLRERATGKPFVPDTNIPLDPVYIAKKLWWALEPLFPKDGSLPNADKALFRCTQVTDTLVKQPYRDTISHNAASDRYCRGYVRILRGEENCAFCFMLAARAASIDEPGAPGLYTSAFTAGEQGSGNEYHGHCDCAVEPIFNLEDDLARLRDKYGYNPDAYYQAYLNARAQANSGDPYKIMAALRDQQEFQH